MVLIALEEAGRPFATETIYFERGDNRSPAYLTINPLGRVPTLVVDGRSLTETVAILAWLAGAYPDAGLMPAATGEVERAQHLADLAYGASTLHPLVSRLRLPFLYGEPADVFGKAATAVLPHLDLVERRLAEGGWWYGEAWSAMDAYVNWAWLRISGASLGAARIDVAPYRALAAHHGRMVQRPAVQRAVARNARALAELAG